MCTMSAAYLYLVVFACIQHIANSGLLTDFYTGAGAISLGAGIISILSRWETHEAKWFPNDPRRHTDDGLDFYVHIDTTELPANLDATLAIEAIQRAVDTWDKIECSANKYNLLIKTDYAGQDIGFGQYTLSGGKSGKDEAIGDIVFGGFLPSQFFKFNIYTDAGNMTNMSNLTNGDISILATTLFFDFNGDIIDLVNTPECSESTEVMFAEIYFNDGFNWGLLDENAYFNGAFDIETVAMHEMGHALSQSHFHDEGNVTTDGNEVVMTPIYSVVDHDLHDVDIIPHCDLWEHWGECGAHAPHSHAQQSMISNIGNIGDDRYSLYRNSGEMSQMSVGLIVLITFLTTNILWCTFLQWKNKSVANYAKVPTFNVSDLSDCGP